MTKEPRSDIYSVGGDKDNSGSAEDGAKSTAWSKYPEEFRPSDAENPAEADRKGSDTENPDIGRV